MTALTIVMADASAERLRTALVLAAASAACGDHARIFFQGDAVRAMVAPVFDPDADRQQAAGLPTLGQLVDEAQALGVAFAACQSSLALLGLTTQDFDPTIEWGGLVGLVATLDPAGRLIVI